MNNTSLIDCLKRNINYSTQFAAFFWQISEDKQPSIFYEHVQAFTEINKELQQLKYHQFYIIAAASAVPIKPKTASNNHLLKAKIITVASTTPVISAVSVSAGDFINLSSAITAVQGKSISTSGVKEICNKWKLCYYCKLQHPNKNAKKCLNKKFSTLHFVNIDDINNINEDVSFIIEKV